MAEPFTILSTGSLAVREPASFAEDPAGYILEEIPFIRIVPHTDTLTCDRIQAFAREILNVIFTSANAVKAVIAALPAIPNWKIYCVGSETGKQVASFFGEAAVQETAPHAEALAEKIIRQGAVREVVFFCGNQRREVLQEKLREKGILLKELTVYRTEPSPMRLTRPYNAILFFSPSGVKSFFTMNRPGPQTLLFALGETTAASLRTYTGNPILVSPRPDKASLLQMALDYHQSHPAT
jgi:uroporphyrinogen-III synthase